MVTIQEIINKEALYLAVVKALKSIKPEIPLSEFERDRRAIVLTCRIMITAVKPTIEKDPFEMKLRIEEAILDAIWSDIKLWHGSEATAHEAAADILAEIIDFI